MNCKCNFCNDIADVRLKYNNQLIPSCMKCVDKKLDENLNRIDNNRNNRLLEAINIIREGVV